jgi:LacI family transcriptional regulator
MSLSNESNDENHLKRLINRGIPFVQFDKISKLIPSSKVIINDQKAASDAVQHLIDMGCKKIAHIRGPENPQNAIDRFLGYKKTLEKNGIPFDSKLVYTCQRVAYEEGFEFAKQIVEDHPDVDGIFAVTDLVAVGVMSYLNEVGIAIPNQIALIGFSNWFMAQVMSPKLSTVDQPSYEMGVAAFNLLLEEMICHKEGKVFIPRTIVLETSVIKRESSLKM